MEKHGGGLHSEVDGHVAEEKEEQEGECELHLLPQTLWISFWAVGRLGTCIFRCVYKLLEQGFPRSVMLLLSSLTSSELISWLTLLFQIHLRSESFCS